MDLLCNGYNTIFTCVNTLTKYCGLIPCFMGEGSMSTSSVAKLFFDYVVRLLGFPQDVISNRDHRLTASLWWELWALLGIKLLMGSANHPQTDGQIEGTHRTLEQTLHCLISEGSLDGAQWHTLLL